MGRLIGGLDEAARRAARRETLLDAALDLFSARGFTATPIETLCQQARVSTKSFYEVFDSRESCYLALMMRTTEDMQHRLGTGVAAIPLADEVAATEALLDVLAHLFGDDPRPAIVLFGRGAATTPRVEQQRRTNRRWSAEFLAAIWKQFQPDEAIPPGVATGTIGGLFDIISDWAADQKEGEPAFDVAVLRERLFGFYLAVRLGSSPSYGKARQSATG